MDHVSTFSQVDNGQKITFLTAVNRGLTIIITTLPSQIQTRLLHFEKTFFCSSMMKLISIVIEVFVNILSYLIN